MEKKNRSLINSIIDNIRDLRSNTYLTNNDNRKQLSQLRNDVYDSINQLTTNTYNNTGMNQISTTYDRLFSRYKHDKSLPQDFSNLFENDNVMNSLSITYMRNKPIYEYDREIDTICSYMPKLEEALETKKDHVLSPDHFSKQYLKIVKDSDFTFEDAKENMFNKDIKIMKKKYKLEEFIEESYSRTAKYGEDFIYHVPYEKAINRLLKNKEKYNSFNFNSTVSESGKVIIESENIKQEIEVEIDKESMKLLKQCNINVEICTNNFLESIVQESYYVDRSLDGLNENSLFTEASVELDETIKNATRGKVGNKNIGEKHGLELRPMDVTIGDKIAVDKSSNDGLIDDGINNDNRKMGLKGCILKSIPRHRVIPIYVDDTIMGYYYFEFQETDIIETSNSGSIFGNKTVDIINNDNMSKSQDNLLKTIAGVMANKLDATFIRNNQDLTREIYSILKYNDIYNTGNSENKMRVTYVPPEDMTHCYFKRDSVTNRGISDLARAMIPAKLWVAMNLTYIIGNMTRGQDKRVYYVKQTVDTNISQTLLNTIDQIKKSNFGLRQVENINNIINVIGKFNDYVIPTSQSGDSPIQFEIMQGQQIEPPTAIMEILEESAINSTDVPLEVVNARLSMDFAVHYTMNNTRFLRKVTKRQTICEDYRMYSSIVTKIYNIEYSKTETLKLKLPPPMFLDVSNTSQIIQNVNELCNNIIEAVIDPNEDEEVKNIFTRKLKTQYLSTHINIDRINSLLEESKLESIVNAQIKKAEDESSDNGY